MRMITGRGTMKVDCVLVTEPTTIGGKDYKPGDLLVSDGEKTWGMPYERWQKKIKGREMRGILEAAEEMHRAPTAK